MTTSVRAALLLAATLPGIAAADPDPDAQFKAADALFEEGRALLEAGQLNEACQRFDAALAKNPNAVGVIVNVAKCQARLGKLATAVATFKNARDHAREAGADPYLAFAEDNIARIEPFVPHLLVEYAQSAPDLTVTIDARAVALADTVDLELDPGPHDIVVSEPGHEPFRAHVVLAKKEHRPLSVPALDSHSTFPLPMVVVAGGAAVVATGVVIGLVARSHYDSALSDNCHGMANDCNATGLSDTSSARSLGNVGTVVGIAGLAVAGTGGVLWWLSRSHEAAATVAVVPTLAPDQLGVAAAGRF